MAFITEKWTSMLGISILMHMNICNGFITSSPLQKPCTRTSNFNRHDGNCLHPQILTVSNTLTGNIINRQNHAPFSSSSSSLQMVPEIFESTSLLQAVEVFDGSSIDPVVVSNIYWSSLTGKIIAVIIGQVLATITFSILTYFLSSQLKVRKQLYLFIINFYFSMCIFFKTYIFITYHN